MVKPSLENAHLGFHCLDARQVLTLFSKEKSGEYEEYVDLTVTSPPYHNLKNYKIGNQIGYGQKWDDYLTDMQKVFASIFKVTQRTGSMWVVADTYRKRGELVQLPLKLSEVAKEAGWTLRDVIIWEKDHTLPWSAKGQLRKSFEYILFFSKSDKFKYHIDRIREPQLKEWWVKFPERYNPKGKTPSGIWKFDIPVQGRWRHGFLRHFCPFPTRLVHRILLLCSDEGDVVMDPFAGSGVVLAVAKAMKRKFIGLDLQKEYIDQYESVVKMEIAKEMEETLREQIAADQWRNDFEKTLIGLRQIKHARLILKRLSSDYPQSYNKVVNLFLVPKGSGTTTPIQNAIFVLTKGKSSNEELISSLSKIAEEPELTTFGIESEFQAVDFDWVHKAPWVGKRLFVYKNGTTWRFAEPFNTAAIKDETGKALLYGVRNGGKPIVSPIKVSVSLGEVVGASKLKAPHLPQLTENRATKLDHYAPSSD